MTDPIDPSDELGSPLDFAVDQQSRLTMATVRRAVARGDAVLAYQPVVQSGRPQHVAFHEGLIRIIDETGRIVPLRDFMPLAETTELGRQIDCLSLSLGLKTLAEEPSIRLSINMSARSIGYPAWIRTLRQGGGQFREFRPQQFSRNRDRRRQAQSTGGVVALIGADHKIPPHSPDFPHSLAKFDVNIRLLGQHVGDGLQAAGECETAR